MCGRFVLLMTPTDLAGVFGTRNAVPNFWPNWNLPPSYRAPVVRHHPRPGSGTGSPGGGRDGVRTSLPPMPAM